MQKNNFEVEGIFVEHYSPEECSNRPPLVFVHGGCHGSWHWRNFLEYFSNAGWDCYALNWYNHYKSMSLPLNHFINRCLADVTEEVGKVVESIGVEPIIIGHSMGGMVAQQYAQISPVKALVLTTSVIPKELGAPHIELPAPIDDTIPFSPPPFEFAKELFFQAVNEEQARQEYALLCDESPRAVREAIEHGLSIDKNKINCPVLVIGAELDLLTPEVSMRKLAKFYQAEYVYVEGKGHNLLTVEGWQEVAQAIEQWLHKQLF